MDYDLKFIITSAIFTLTVSTIFYWYYQNYVAPYSHFPSYNLGSRIIYWLLTNECPKHIPITSFVFQKLLNMYKQQELKDVLLIWIFQPFLLIFGEESVKTFSQEPEILDKSFFYEVLKDSLGMGLITSNGDTWKTHRKMINPAFRRRMLKNHLPVFNKHATALVKKLTDVVNEPSINMADYYFYCSLDIICESMCELNVEENDAVIREAHGIIERLSSFTTYRMLHPYLYWNFMTKLSPVGRAYLKDYEKRENLPKTVVKNMKKFLEASSAEKTFEEEDSEYHSSHKSVARLLLEIHSKDVSFSAQIVLDHLKTFIAAGYETIGNTLMWCTFMLGLHQDIQEEVFNEVKSLGDKDVTYEDLAHLTYLDCFIKETLRLYPTVPVYGRILNKDIQCGKYKVPKGTNIVFCPYAYHRNPALYPEPERFDPDRFRNENSDRHSWTHIAFAEGLRNCIGKHFAILEIKVILVHILRKFKLIALDRKEDVDLDWAVSLISTKPLRTKLSLRN